MSSWHSHWAAVRQRVEADPELQRLYARLRTLNAGGAAHARVEREYLERRRRIEAQASREVALREIAEERANKAAYMRDYRARKRAVREALGAARTS